VTGRLEGKVAIVTGSSRGLGQYCAFAYAREGAKVVIAARTQQDSERLPGTIYDSVAQIEDRGGQAMAVVCNVADPDSVQAMTDEVLQKWGQIDVVMANAGILPGGGVSTMQLRHFELEFRVNVVGAFYTLRSALPSMLERGTGSLITISSGAADPGRSGHYAATKRAVEAMTVGMADELKDTGIAVNCLKPTSSIRTAGAIFRRTPAERAEYKGLTPESYEEAAILLALQTPATCTGAVFTDAQAVKALGSAEDLSRFKALYPASWAESIS